MRHAMGDVALAGSPFPPIAEYAFLSDCEVSALVAPNGNVEWLCCPLGPGAINAVMHVIRADRALARDQPLLQVVRREPAADVPTPALGGQIDDHG